MIREIQYEYTCAAGWKERVTRVANNYTEFVAILDECLEKAGRVLDNPICLDCLLLQKECDGVKNQIWTGCKKKVTKDG